MLSEPLACKAEASTEEAIPLRTPEPGELTPRAETWSYHAGGSHGCESELLARQAARESMARTYPRGMPLAIGRALGAEVFSVDGRRYLDFFAGAGGSPSGTITRAWSRPSKSSCDNWYTRSTFQPRRGTRSPPSSSKPCLSGWRGR